MCSLVVPDASNVGNAARRSGGATCPDNKWIAENVQKIAEIKDALSQEVQEANTQLKNVEIEKNAISSRISLNSKKLETAAKARDAAQDLVDQFPDQDDFQTVLDSMQGD